MCNCVGAKAVLEIYEDDKGRGRLVIKRPEDTEPIEVSGEIHTTKVKCFECGEIFLMEMTFPDEEDIDGMF